jgi:hypothetical protein
MTELTKRNGVTIRHRERLPSKRKVKKIIRDVSAALAALGVHCARVAAANEYPKFGCKRK